MWILTNRACGRTARCLGEFLDGTLPLRGRRAVEAHLLACAACRRELETLRRTLALVTSLPRPELSGDFEASLRARLEAAGPSDARAAGSRLPFASRERHLRLPWPSPLRRLAPAGVVAAVVAGLAVWHFPPARLGSPAPRPAPAYVAALVHEHRLLTAGADINATVVHHNLDGDLFGDGDED